MTALAGGSSEPLFLPPRARNVTAKALPVDGGGATIQYTLDDPESVEANPANAQWDDWEAGLVTVSTTRALVGAVTALRIQATAENAVLQVVAAYEH